MIGLWAAMLCLRRPRVDPVVLADVVMPAIASGVASEIHALVLHRGATESTARRRSEAAARRTLCKHKVSGRELRCIRAALKAAPDRDAMVEAATACAGEPLTTMIPARRCFWLALCESLCRSTTGGLDAGEYVAKLGGAS